MNKQTVGKIFGQAQIITGKQIDQKQAKQLMLSPEEENSQQLINLMKQALQEASQAVLQIQAAYPLKENISQAKNKINLALQKLQQLEVAGTSRFFTKGADYHLKQLEYQLETAAGTIAMIDQSLK